MMGMLEYLEKGRGFFSSEDRCISFSGAKESRINTDEPYVKFFFSSAREG